MLKKENFKGVYPSSEEEPSDEEVEYVFSILETIDVSNPDYINVQGDTGCYCAERTLDEHIANFGDDPEFKYVAPDIWSFVVDATFEEVEDTEDERILYIVYCTECHSWKLCD